MSTPTPRDDVDELAAPNGVGETPLRPAVVDSKLAYAVVIPTLGERPTLPRLLSSIRRQTRSPAEIIIAMPSSAPAVHAEGVRIVRSHASLPAQRAAGVKAATAPIVLFIDDDVVLEDDFADELCRVWERRGLERISGVAGSVVNEADGPRWRRVLRAAAGLSHAALFVRRTTVMASGHVAVVNDPREEEEVRFVRGGCMSFRRDLLLVEPPDEQFDGYVYGEDLDLAARLSRHAPLIHTPRARCHHLPLGSGLGAGVENAHRRSRMFALYRAHHRRPGILGHVAWEWANATEAVTLAVRGLRDRDLAPFRAFLDGLGETRRQLKGAAEEDR